MTGGIRYQGGHQDSGRLRCRRRAGPRGLVGPAPLLCHHDALGLLDHRHGLQAVLQFPSGGERGPGAAHTFLRGGQRCLVLRNRLGPFPGWRILRHAGGIGRADHRSGIHTATVGRRQELALLALVPQDGANALARWRPWPLVAAARSWNNRPGNIGQGELSPGQGRAGMTAEVVATLPAAGPTRHAVATTDSRLTAQLPVPAWY